MTAQITHRQGTWLPLSLAVLVVLTVWPAVVATAAAPAVTVGPLTVELIADRASLTPCDTIQVGLWFQLEPGWHLYWRNPGDAGLPPRLSWILPQKFTVSDIHWMTPHVIEQPPLVAYGYSDSVLYPVALSIPCDVQAGQTVRLSVDADWLVCKERCIPGKATVNLDLSVEDIPRSLDISPNRSRFVWATNHSPLSASDWSNHAAVFADSLNLFIQPPEEVAVPKMNVRFLPNRAGQIEEGAPQQVELTPNGLRIQVTRSMYSDRAITDLDGLLLTSFEGHAEQAVAYDVSIHVNPEPVTSQASSEIALGRALLLALLGGLLLNLMPCVLPVLSLKVLGFVQQAGQSLSHRLAHGGLFTMGVLISFWLLAGALMVLRASGEQLGWGFQLQSPAFLALLVSFMFLFSLNLLGQFEIGLAWSSAGAVMAGRSGLLGSFISGITATLVATPCTAPFMGTALGFSLSQPPLVALLVFTALGAGLALPYLVLPLFPRLLRLVPKPGRWMESLKQFMGFLLMATVVWLLWVLGRQTGTDVLVVMLGGLVLTGLGVWVYSRWGGLAASVLARRLSLATLLVFLVISILLGQTAISFSTPGATQASASDDRFWRPYSREAVARALASGEPVFIDFTADWCLSCKVNERVTLDSESVRKRFADLGISAFKADWTSRDPEITRALAEFGRNSVPLYVVYEGHPQATPRLLPEILTRDIVLNALQSLTPAAGVGSPPQGI